MIDLQVIRSRYDNAIFEEQKLSNGVIVYLQKPQLNTDAEGIITAFYPWVGSCIEAPHEHGIAHFFEHVPFDTKRLQPVQQAGGSFNGSTGVGHTQYYIKLPNDSFDLAVRSLAVLTSDVRFDEGVVERERGVISREYDMKWSDGDYVILSEGAAAFLGKNHPMGHYPIGIREVIQSMTLEQLMSFRNTHYHAGNLRLVVGGAFSELSEQSVMERLEKTFGNLPYQSPSSIEFVLPLDQKGKVIRKVNPQFKRDRFDLMYYGAEKLSDLDSDALNFLSRSLNGLHSPLVQELRIKRGWVYESNLCGMDEGPFGWIFMFHCFTPKKNFPELWSIFRGILEQLDKEYLEEQLRARRLKRKSEFSNSIDVAHKFPNRMTWDGQWKNHHYWEGIEDEQTVERVLAWRDRLLIEKPFIFEAVTEE